MGKQEVFGISLEVFFAKAIRVFRSAGVGRYEGEKSEA